MHSAKTKILGIIIGCLFYCSASYGQAMDGGADFFGPLGMRRSDFLIDISNSYRSPSSHSQDFNKVSVWQNRGDFSYTTGKDTEGGFSARAGRLHFATDSKAFIDYYDYRLGTKLRTKKENGDVVGGSIQVGSSSDKPFHSLSEVSYNVTFSFVNNVSEKSRVSYFINMSNTRSFMSYLPLPGVAYTYAPKMGTSYTIGIPFFMIRQPLTDKLSLFAVAVIPVMTRATLNYQIAGPFSIFAGYDFSQQVYFRQARQEKSDRFFYDEMKGFLGFKFPIFKYLMATTDFGWAFRRSTFETKSYFQSKKNKINLEDSLYGSLQLTAFF